MKSRSLNAATTALAAGLFLAAGLSPFAPVASAQASASSALSSLGSSGTTSSLSSTGPSFLEGLGLSSTVDSLLADTSSQLIQQVTPRMKRSTHTLDVADYGERGYTLYTPEDYDPARNYPVLFGFPGYGHTAKEAEGLKLHEASAGNAIVVYPEPRMGTRGKYAWEGPDYAAAPRGADVDFVKQILDQLDTEYKIDHSRIYAAGISNGGGMALVAACKAPEVFAAVASVATASYQAIFEDCAPGHVPTLMIHGTKDFFPMDVDSDQQGGRAYATFGAWDIIGRRNGCDTQQSNVLVQPAAGGERYVYRDCTNTELHKVEDGGHTWFESNPNAAQEVWSFLRTARK